MNLNKNVRLKLVNNSDLFLFFPAGIPCQNGAPWQGVMQLHHNPSYVHPICGFNGWMCISKEWWQWQEESYGKAMAKRMEVWRHLPVSEHFQQSSHFRYYIYLVVVVSILGWLIYRNISCSVRKWLHLNDLLCKFTLWKNCSNVTSWKLES